MTTHPTTAREGQPMTDETAAQAAPEGGSEVGGLQELLATHGHMPCSQTSPTVSAWWAQCYGCDWKGPRRSHSSEREADHLGHLADVIAAVTSERVRVVEDERDAAVGALDVAPEILRLAEMSDQVGHWKARAESAEAALAAEKEAHAALRGRIEALDRLGRMSFNHADLRALLAGGGA